MSALLTNTYTKKGILYGLLGTLFMSVIMLIGMGTGMSPIPEPIPAAIAKGLLGNVPKPVIMGFAIITHFGYGAFWGAVLFNWVKTNGNIWPGLGCDAVAHNGAYCAATVGVGRFRISYHSENCRGHTGVAPALRGYAGMGVDTNCTNPVN